MSRAVAKYFPPPHLCQAWVDYREAGVYPQRGRGLGKGGRGGLVDERNPARQRAVSAIDGLKQASEATNEELGERVRTARALADELSLMVEAGNSIADKLGRTERPSPQSTPVQAAAPRSTPQAASPRDAAVAARAANQLLEALKKKAR